MDGEPMLKKPGAGHLPGVCGASVASSEDGNSSILSVDANRRNGGGGGLRFGIGRHLLRRNHNNHGNYDVTAIAGGDGHHHRQHGQGDSSSLFSRTFYSGPVAFHLALCSLLISLALSFMFAWLWRYEIPARVTVLEKRLEMVDQFLLEQKRAMHFLRKEVLFASSRLQSMNAYEAFRSELASDDFQHENSVAYVAENNNEEQQPLMRLAGEEEDFYKNQQKQRSNSPPRRQEKGEEEDGGTRLRDELKPPGSAERHNDDQPDNKDGHVRREHEIDGDDGDGDNDGRDKAMEKPSSASDAEESGRLSAATSKR